MPGEEIGIGAASALVGLELMAPSTPSLESPPTNSLPPLLWPRFTGVVGVVSSGDNVGELSSARPVVSAELNEKVGSVDCVRR